MPGATAQIRQNLALLLGLEGRIEVVTIDTLINLCLHKMFPGYEVAGSGSFRVIRDSEIEIDDEAADLVVEFESERRALEIVA